MSQIRTAEILLRKVLPDLSKTDINDTSPQRYVIEVPPELTREQWIEKYGPKDQTIQ